MTTPTTLRVFSFEPIGSRGGVDHYDRGFCEGLARRPGVEVVWVTADTATDVDGSYEKWAVFAGMYGKEPAWVRGSRYARAMSALVRRAVASARSVPTVVDQQWIEVLPLEYAAMRVAQRAGVPWFLTPHEAVPYGKSPEQAGLRRWLFRHSDGMFALSEPSAAIMRSILGSARVPVHLTPHGHLNAHYDMPEGRVDQAGARRQLGLEGKGPLLLFVGELRDVKGIDVLLRAMPKVLSAHPDARLLVSSSIYRVGAEPYMRMMAELGVAGSVDVRWKWVAEAELALLHRAADLIVLPYRAASQSGACLTAYAFQRAVVASSVGGLTGQVADGVTGRSVPPGEVDALAAAIVDMLGDRATLLAMGEAAHAWAARTFDWDKVAETTEHAFRAGLARRARMIGGL